VSNAQIGKALSQILLLVLFALILIRLGGV